MLRRIRAGKYGSQSSSRRHLKLGTGLEPLEVRRLLTASVLINEIYLNPPGSPDLNNEYIELRGTPNLPLDNHYFIILENEDNENHNGKTGQIDRVFDLSGQTIGSNGYLTLRQKSNPYSVAPGTTNLANTGTGNGWGIFSNGTSTLKVEAEDNKLEMENGGGTYMVIKNNGDPVTNAPHVLEDLDVGNNGLDVPTGKADWEIVDAIGVHGETSETPYGRLYAPVNFGPGDSTNFPPGATYVNLPFEIEYMARWGDLTGQTSDDWDIANLTDNFGSGYTGTGDFRQSATDHPDFPGDPLPEGSVVESYKTVPYGTNRTGTLGDVNFPGAIAPPASTVVGQQLFYNASSYDLNTGVDGNDDLAIATNKTPYLPGGGAMAVTPVTFPNDQKSYVHVSGYSRGINGLMVDITGLHPSISASDFTFKVGANNTPSLWATALAPTSVTVRTTGLGLASGNTRVEIIWPANSIRNTWLEVRVKANANTGLDDNAQAPNGDGIGNIFYYGNRVADSGSGQTVNFNTNATDEILARNNPANNVPLTNRFDYNKDKNVNATDQILARNNPGNIPLINIANPPGAPPAAPAAVESSLQSDGVIASALAITTPVIKTANASTQLPALRQPKQPAGGASVAAENPNCQHLAEKPLASRAKAASAVDRLAEAWGHNPRWFRDIAGD